VNFFHRCASVSHTHLGRLARPVVQWVSFDVGSSESASDDYERRVAVAQYVFGCAVWRPVCVPELTQCRLPLVTHLNYKPFVNTCTEHGGCCALRLRTQCAQFADFYTKF
jgi:hypothetical protein